jgi:hypothetical protein
MKDQQNIPVTIQDVCFSVLEQDQFKAMQCFVIMVTPL